jgi:hypothetical protein
MRLLYGIVGFWMFAATSWSQVFEPIVVRTPETEKVSTISIHGSSFEWEGLGTRAKTGALVSFQTPIDQKGEFLLNGWASRDTQTLGSESANINWYNLGLTWLAARTLRNNFGLSVGVLVAQVEDYGNANWVSTDLVSSFALDPSGRWTLGATLGYVSGTSFSGEFEGDKPASGFTYGASLSYRVSRQFSLNVGFWTIDLTNEGGGRISRFNGGMSFHF